MSSALAIAEGFALIGQAVVMYLLLNWIRVLREQSRGVEADRCRLIAVLEASPTVRKGITTPDDTMRGENVLTRTETCYRCGLTHSMSMLAPVVPPKLAGFRTISERLYCVACADAVERSIACAIADITDISV